MGKTTKKCKNVPQRNLSLRLFCCLAYLLPALWDSCVWLVAGHGPPGWETASPSGPHSPHCCWPQSCHLGLKNKSRRGGGVNHCTKWIPYSQCFVWALQEKLSSLPAGCSARLWVMIWQMRVVMGTGVALDACNSLWSVRLLSSELPLEWSRDSSSFYNHTNQFITWLR